MASKALALNDSGRTVAVFTDVSGSEKGISKMAVRIVEVVASRERSKLTTISQREVGIRENEELNLRPLCELIIKKMVRDGVIPDPQQRVSGE